MDKETFTSISILNTHTEIKRFWQKSAHDGRAEQNEGLCFEKSGGPLD